MKPTAQRNPSRNGGSTFRTLILPALDWRQLPSRQRRHCSPDTFAFQRAFSGQLTAKWREARMKELLVEMEQQARALNLPSAVEATP